MAGQLQDRGTGGHRLAFRRCAVQRLGKDRGMDHAGLAAKKATSVLDVHQAVYVAPEVDLTDELLKRLNSK